MSFNPVTIYDGADSVFLELYLIDDVEITDNGNMDAMTDQCGHTEVRRQGSTNWTMTVNGLVPEHKLDKLKQLNEGGVTKRIETDLHSMPIVLQDISLKQVNKEAFVEYRGDLGETGGKVFPFQLQFKLP